MSAISDATAAMNAALDAVDASINGIGDDVAFLKETIQKLQDSAGTVTPEDQALIDALQARIGGLGTRVAELDAATERPAPPA